MLEFIPASSGDILVANDKDVSLPGPSTVRSLPLPKALTGKIGNAMKSNATTMNIIAKVDFTQITFSFNKDNKYPVLCDANKRKLVDDLNFTNWIYFNNICLLTNLNNCQLPFNTMSARRIKPIARSFSLFIIAQFYVYQFVFSFGLPETDVINTSKGDVTLHFVGHASLMLEYAGLFIHIDPTLREADYSKMPKADLVLITHQHGDHFDKDALKQICTENTLLILTKTCAAGTDGQGTNQILENGEKIDYKSIEITAVPAYNLVHLRDDNKPYHPKGEGNGYVLRFGDTSIYIAGDTENISEMKALEGIDIAFLPMNLPYTMTPEMVTDAARAFHPKILYPYHYGNTDVNQLLDLLDGEKDIEIRIRDLK